jgi:hypothetical protein
VPLAVFDAGFPELPDALSLASFFFVLAVALSFFALPDADSDALGDAAFSALEASLAAMAGADTRAVTSAQIAIFMKNTFQADSLRKTINLD